MASRGRRQDHYEVLGVNPDAPDEVVRAAYRVLAGKHHPDRNPSDRNAELRLKRLNAAFQVLGDPARRKQYDELTQSPEDGDESPPGYGRPAQPQRYGPPPGQRPPPARSTPQPVGPRRTEKVASVFGRVIGYVLGAALVSAFFAALHGGCDEKRRADFSAAPVTTVTTAATATDPAGSWIWTTMPDYRIAFPATPRPAEHSTLATRAGIARVTSIGLNRPSGSTYGVQMADYPTGAVVSEQGSIDGMLKGAGDEGDGTPKVLADRRRQLGDCNGRDFSASTKTFMFRALLCVNGSRVYMAMTAVPVRTDSASVSEATAFLDSFSVTAATPVTTAQTASSRPIQGTGSPVRCACNPQSADELAAMSEACLARCFPEGH